MKAVKHTTHHIHIKQILNNAMDIHKEAIDQFKFMPFKEMIYVESVFKDRRYHIPLKYLSLWSEHPHPNEILSLIQDVITIVKK
ncbi:MAG: hypothetical protein FJ356_01610 [Thaumarchaeota archaeon]|nr:hypothetical protein [Nitrososphaerota archaeon]